MNMITIKNTSKPLPSTLIVSSCESFFCRLKGMMFRSRLDRSTGLLFTFPRENRVDSSIHMLFVFMDLAAVWVNSDLLVVDRVRARTWRPAYAPSSPAKYLLEIHPERLEEFSFGDQLEFIHE